MSRAMLKDRDSEGGVCMYSLVRTCTPYIRYCTIIQSTYGVDMYIGTTTTMGVVLFLEKEHECHPG